MVLLRLLKSGNFIHPTEIYKDYVGITKKLSQDADNHPFILAFAHNSPESYAETNPSSCVFAAFHVSAFATACAILMEYRFLKLNRQHQAYISLSSVNVSKGRKMKENEKLYPHHQQSLTGSHNSSPIIENNYQLISNNI